MPIIIGTLLTFNRWLTAAAVVFCAVEITIEFNLIDPTHQLTRINTPLFAVICRFSANTSFSTARTLFFSFSYRLWTMQQNAAHVGLSIWNLTDANAVECTKTNGKNHASKLNTMNCHFFGWEMTLSVPLWNLLLFPPPFMSVPSLYVFFLARTGPSFLSNLSLQLNQFQMNW